MTQDQFPGSTSLQHWLQRRPEELAIYADHVKVVDGDLREQLAEKLKPSRATSLL